MKSETNNSKNEFQGLSTKEIYHEVSERDYQEKINQNNLMKGVVK